jgi:hypothetical protein
MPGVPSPFTYFFFLNSFDRYRMTCLIQHLLLQQLRTSQKSCTESGYDCRMTVLRISNVTERDGGIYTCVLKDKYNNNESETRSVRVIGEFYFNPLHSE